MNPKSLIDKALDSYLPKRSRVPKKLHSAMRYSVFSGGKRLRPILTLESASVCGGNYKMALAAACAIELVHTYSLIHDDLPAMDDDDYRRGRPACHKAFDEATAILAGDALLTLAFNVIARYPDAGKSALIIKDLSEAIGTYGMIGGQAADIIYKSKTKNIKMLKEMHYLKTAKLFEATMKAGAIISGAGKKELDAMAGYGLDLGMAFQIADDISDIEDYASILGVDKARRDAIKLIKKAKGRLEIFGAKAKKLCEMADGIML